MSDPLATMIADTFRSCRKDGLSIEDTAEVISEAMRRYLEERGMDDAEYDAERVQVQSIFGARTGLPLVDFKVGFEHWTMPVEQARQHGLNILTCAEAASQDAGMYRWLTLQMDMSAQAAAAAIADLRRFRGDQPKDDWRTPEQQLKEEG